MRSPPALWTDFSFAVWAEEWGFVGCVAVLRAYGLLVLWVLKIGREAQARIRSLRFHTALTLKIRPDICW